MTRQLGARISFRGDVEVHIRVDADADDATLDELKEATMNASPVYDSVVRPVAIRTTVARGT